MVGKEEKEKKERYIKYVSTNREIIVCSDYENDKLDHLFKKVSDLVKLGGGKN